MNTGRRFASGSFAIVQHTDYLRISTERRAGIQRLVSKALAMCRGILPGATNMTSKLM